MTKYSNAFSEIDTSVRVPIKMGNGAIIKSEGRGTVAVQTKKGTKLIKNVLYVLDLDQN